MNGPAQRAKELGEQRALRLERDAARRRTAFSMFEAGCSNMEVARVVSASEKTVARWRKEWRP